MGIRIYNPTSPGRRKSSVLTYEELTKHRPEKSLLTIIKSQAGRNQQGKITVRHRGGGHKRFYRLVDLRRIKYDKPATVLGIEYDPNRSAFIALVKYEDGVKDYILAPHGLKPGDRLVSSQNKTEIKLGNRLPLEHIPAGNLVYNIELFPGHGGKLARSAGVAATVMGLEGECVQLKMPSGEIRLVPKKCQASIGQLSNIDNINVRFGKAGRRRHLGFRPTVRGKAMNPVDHPHGGGEGGSSIGMKHPKTPWGKPALGVRTRQKTKKSNNFIIKRRPN